MEIQALHLLDRAGADIGEANVIRTGADRIKIKGVVENAERKSEILNALGSMVDNPAVTVDVVTVEEEQRRRAASRSVGPPALYRLEAPGNNIPAYPELRRYFVGESKESVDEAHIRSKVHDFANRVSKMARESLAHAAALKNIVNRFSTEEIDLLEGESRARLLWLTANRARVVRQETRRLREHLEPVFFRNAPLGEQPADDDDIKTAADLKRVAEKLFEQTRNNDRAIRSVFAISAETNTPAVVLTSQLWNSLRRVEKLAESISKMP
jgi:hypothetical protein